MKKTSTLLLLICCILNLCAQEKLPAVQLLFIPTYLNTTSTDFNQITSAEKMTLDKAAQFGMDLELEFKFANGPWRINAFQQFFLPQKFTYKSRSITSVISGAGVGYDLVENEHWEITPLLTLFTQFLLIKNTDGDDQIKAVGLNSRLRIFRRFGASNCKIGWQAGYARNITFSDHEIFTSEPPLLKGAIFNNWHIGLGVALEFIQNKKTRTGKRSIGIME